jgi:hypothetical protein
MLSKENFIYPNTYDAYKDAHKEATENGHTYWIDDIPVSRPLYNFCREFKHKRPDALIHVSSNPMWGGGRQYKVYYSLSVSFKEARSVVVGGLDVDLADGTDCTYTVTSKRISNEKYAHYNKQFHTKSTKKLPLAMKNALQFLKPYSMDEMFLNKSDNVRRAVADLKESAEDMLRYQFSVNRDDLFTEICHMLQSNYTPTTQKFREILDNAKEHAETMKEMFAYNPRKCFVWVLADRIQYKYEDDENVVVHSLNELPEDIRNKISVLQIAEKGSPIKDVGVKVNSKMYWTFA